MIPQRSKNFKYFKAVFSFFIINYYRHTSKSLEMNEVCDILNKGDLIIFSMSFSYNLILHKPVSAKTKELKRNYFILIVDFYICGKAN
jgi:hypothetical protein